METTKILTANLLDILFDGRNKSYGAYELRQHYQRRMTKSLLLTAGICVAIGCAAWLKNTFAVTEITPVVKIHDGLRIEDIKPIEEKLPPVIPPAAAPKTEVPKVQTIKLTTPVVTNEVVVDAPPTQDEIEGSKIGAVTQLGVKGADIVTPSESIDVGKGLLTNSTKKEESDLPFTKVEVDASYMGNWKSFLERNLSGEVPVDNGAAPGVYTVTVQFIVDINGTISDIKPLTNLGYGMEQEAMRVIKKSGRWKPAIQNGREVKAYRRQPITFRVLE